MGTLLDLYYHPHQRAEHGVASHWEYKDKGAGSDLAWLSRIVDWQQETEDPGEFMSALKLDLEQDEVFVFTPAGGVVTLGLLGLGPDGHTAGLFSAGDLDRGRDRLAVSVHRPDGMDGITVTLPEETHNFLLD